MRSFIILLLSAFWAYAQENSYELGRGVQVGDMPIFIGGYTSVQYKKDQNSSIFSVDDVALMLYGGVNKFSYMAEAEYKDLYVKKHTEAENIHNSDRNIYVERLYVDYTTGESFVVRVGKFNSPIGYWNMLPINTLRETTSNPKTKTILFPEFTTGLGVSYTSYQSAEIKYDLMVQNNKDLDDKYNSYEIDQHFGLGLTYAINEFSFKVNGGYFHQTEKELLENDRYYFLVSGKYELEKFSLVAEIGAQASNERFTTPYALYLQGAYKVTPKHSLNLRLEAYEDNIDKSSNTHEEEYEEEYEHSETAEYLNSSKQDLSAIFGYTYRPSYPIAFKVEYQLHKIKTDNQFLASFSVLF